jgi:hypothetical protein
LIFGLCALLDRFFRASQVVGAAHQRQMREGLRKIADEPPRSRVVLLAQEPDIVAQRDQPLEQSLCVFDATFNT